MKPEVHKTNIRTCTVRFSHAEIKGILLDKLIELAMPRLRDGGAQERELKQALHNSPQKSPRWLKVEVRFEDETEGSPSYRVGPKAVVTIVEDLDYEADRLNVAAT